MTTGVDAQTCRLIVLDKNINSLTEFKQIIGRGTRVREDYNKMYFTIIDFRDATKLFYDPAFDGEAVLYINLNRMIQLYHRRMKTKMNFYPIVVQMMKK